MVKKVFVFGSAFPIEDCLAFRVAKKLRKRFAGKIDFVFVENVESEEWKQRELIAMDVVMGINRVELIENLEKISWPNKVNAHDFDFGFQLLLLKKTGVVEKAKIIGIPFDYSEKKAVVECEKLIIASLL